jgi:hypothetical protein
MRHDELTPRGGDEAGRGRHQPANLPELPAADREVPLPPGAEFVALHAWLDGEGEEMPVTTAQAARQREVWRRINEDAAKMHRLSSPPFLEQKVMQALSQQLATPAAATAPVEAVAAARTPSVTWPIAIAIGLACAAAGAAFVALLG